MAPRYHRSGVGSEATMTERTVPISTPRLPERAARVRGQDTSRRQAQAPACSDYKVSELVGSIGSAAPSSATSRSRNATNRPSGSCTGHVQARQPRTARRDRLRAGSGAWVGGSAAIGGGGGARRGRSAQCQRSAFSTHRPRTPPRRSLSGCRCGNCDTCSNGSVRCATRARPPARPAGPARGARIFNVLHLDLGRQLFVAQRPRRWLRCTTAGVQQSLTGSTVSNIRSAGRDLDGHPASIWEIWTST